MRKRFTTRIAQGLHQAGGLRRAASRRRWLQGLGRLAGLAGAPWLATPASATPTSTPPWRPDHTVIVILENLSAFEATARQLRARNAPVYGPSADWPWLRSQAARGARLTQSHFGRTPYGSALPCRPSQPNYLYLFSGHHQGILPTWFEDPRSTARGTALRDSEGRLLAAPKETTVGVGNSNVPLAWLPLSSPNLGAAILQTGGSFLSFSESLPYPSWNCGTDSSLVPCALTHAPTDDYRRKHNPAVNWTDQSDPTSPRGRRGDLARHVLPVSVNLGFEPTEDPTLKKRFRGFDRDAQGKPLGFEHLPSVCLVVPNEQHDAHSASAQIADDWLRDHIGAYADWAMANNSLLIVTFDEDGSTDARQGDAYMTGAHAIPTVFVGPGVVKGDFNEPVDHLNVLATVLWLHGALDRFREDFRRYHGVKPGDDTPLAKAWANLKPIGRLFKS
jgi:phosphatidylinositol-3-phosphatase